MINWLKVLFSGRPKVARMAVETLHQSLQSPSPPRVIDVRSKEEYAFHGHIRGAMLVPWRTIDGQLAAIPPERTIVCVDRAGRRGEQVCRLLLEKGYTNIFNLHGGILAWKKAGLPLRRQPVT